MTMSIKQQYMRKADFEKNVQEKMQELRFKPSEGVWKRVEAGIGEKKRRILIPWFIAAALLLAVVGYFVAVSPTKNYVHTNSNQPGQSIANKETSAQKQNAGTSESQVHASESLNTPVDVTKKNKPHEEDAINSTSTVSKNVI